MTTLYEAMMIQGREVQACQIFPGTYKDWKCSVSARCDLFPFYQIFKFHITNTGGKNSIKATDLCNTPDENLGVYIYVYIWGCHPVSDLYWLLNITLSKSSFCHYIKCNSILRFNSGTWFISVIERSVSFGKLLVFLG